MPLPLPNLDDRSYAELVAEARRLIPSLYPAWTDHNPTDPGIVLVELLAWLTELVIYHINEIPRENYETFLRLLNGRDWSYAGDLDAAMRDTVLTLRERHRAVTTDDYEYLATMRWPNAPEAAALGVAGQIKRARCVPRRFLEGAVGTDAPGHVSLVIVPAAPDDPRRPAPTFELRAALWTWLDERRMLGTRHHVVGPSFVQVTLTVSLALRRDALPGEVRERAVAAVAAFFDPLNGGADGQGWPFGRNVYRSEIFQLLDGVAGVDYVAAVQLQSEAGREIRANNEQVAIRLEPHELVALRFGAENVTIANGSDAARPPRGSQGNGR